MKWYIHCDVIFVYYIHTERGKVWNGYNQMLSRVYLWETDLKVFQFSFVICIFQFSTMERNHIYNNFKSYKSELCRLEFSTNMGLQLGLHHCQGKRRNQLFGFTHGAGVDTAKGSICGWLWSLSPVPGNSNVRHTHLLSILFPVCWRRCSGDVDFPQEKEVWAERGPLLAVQCICTNIYAICSESLLPATYQNCQWLPIIYKFFGMVYRGLWGLSLVCISPWGSFQIPSDLPTWNANRSLMNRLQWFLLPWSETTNIHGKKRILTN